jgi:hypothetical protein
MIPRPFPPGLLLRRRRGPGTQRERIEQQALLAGPQVQLPQAPHRVLAAAGTQEEQARAVRGEREALRTAEPEVVRAREQTGIHASVFPIVAETRRSTADGVQ